MESDKQLEGVKGVAGIVTGSLDDHSPKAGSTLPVKKQSAKDLSTRRDKEESMEPGKP